MNIKGLLRTLGKLGKGGATIAGAVLGLGGAAFGGGDELGKCVEVVLHQPAGTATFLGVALALFGLGRKAGWVGGQDGK